MDNAMIQGKPNRGINKINKFFYSSIVVETIYSIRKEVLKLELTKSVFSTNDKNIINYLKAIFDTQEKNWFEELPDEIKVSVEKGLKQSSKGETIPHAEMQKQYRKWLKK